jgi:NADH:ubiquinone oxidoreductase subunit 2 (subunit N)
MTKKIISTEAIMKYFIFNALASIIFLCGTGFIYLAVGSTNINFIPLIYKSLNGMLPNIEMMANAAGLLLFIAILMKIGVVPFHLWFVNLFITIPYTITLIISTLPKIPYLYLLLILRRIFPSSELQNLFLFFTLFYIFTTLIVSALSALLQNNIKKFLAFSIIFNNGFLLSSTLLPQNSAIPLILSFTLFYTITLSSIFITLIFFKNSNSEIHTLKELIKLSSNKFIAFSFLIAILSLAGIPPFSFFLIKFCILTSLIQKGFILTSILLLAINLFATYYYIRLTYLIFFIPYLNVNFPFTRKIMHGYKSLDFPRFRDITVDTLDKSPKISTPIAYLLSFCNLSPIILIVFPNTIKIITDIGL